MIEINLVCTENGRPTLFLARKDGDEWLFWCQDCARVFLVDAESAEQILRCGNNGHCSMVTTACRC